MMNFPVHNLLTISVLSLAPMVILASSCARAQNAPPTVATAPVAGLAQTVQLANPRALNIVLIMADAMGFSDFRQDFQDGTG